MAGVAANRRYTGLGAMGVRMAASPALIDAPRTFWPTRATLTSTALDDWVIKLTRLPRIENGRRVRSRNFHRFAEHSAPAS